MDVPYEKQILKNGLKVLYIPRKSCYGAVAVTLIGKNGRVDETHDNLSYTHMGEHLMCLLTSKHNKDETAIMEKIGFEGITNNAYTGEYEVGYWYIMNNKNIKWILTLLSQMLFDFEFHGDWKHQINIVVEEVRMRNSDLWISVYENIHRHLFPKHRLSATFEQEITSLNNANPMEVVNYNKNKMNPSEMVLCVEGDFDLSIIQQMVQSLFSQRKHTDYKLSIPPIILKQFEGPLTIRQDVPGDQVKNAKIIMIWRHNTNMFDQIKISQLDVMMKYFCSGFHSILYNRLREKEGLVYGIISKNQLSPEPKRVPSRLTIIINVIPKNINKVLEIIEEEIKLLKARIPSHHHMQRLKNMLWSEENQDNINNEVDKYSEYYGQQWLWDQTILSKKEYYRLRNHVNEKNIQQISREIFNEKNLLITIGEPSKRT